MALCAALHPSASTAAPPHLHHEMVAYQHSHTQCPASAAAPFIKAACCMPSGQVHPSAMQF
eukprot:14725773-Ditylum_brightwellii.AAC.1